MAMPAAGGAAPDPALSRDHVREVVNRSGTSFAMGMRILPRPRREAMFAVYAFCREVDDVADDPGEADAKLAQLDAWRSEIDRLFAGTPRRPTTVALAEALARYDLPKAEFLEVLDGMETDARGGLCGPDMAALRRYCRQVAGAVGMLSIRVFGDTTAAAPGFALALGEALQLTNILRDVDEDAAEGRLYLPDELLTAHGITSRAPLAVAAHPARAGVAADLAAQARRRYAEADQALAQADRRAQRPALLMMGIYERILDGLEARGWAVHGPLRLGKAAKIRAAFLQGLWRPAWRPST